MNESLYFLPKIARALQEKDAATALRKTFEEIRQLGSQAAYTQGYQQFLQFMEEIRLRIESSLRNEEDSIPDVLAALLLERVDQALEDEPRVSQTSAESQPSEWQERYTELWAEICIAMDCPPVCEILLERDNALVAACALGTGRNRQSVGHITAGEYRLVLDTGRFLWRGRLDGRHVVWSKAFPAQPLKMAADTGTEGLRPTWEEGLLGGTLILRVFPGLEAGRIELEARSPEN